MLQAGLLLLLLQQLSVVTRSCRCCCLLLAQLLLQLHNIVGMALQRCSQCCLGTRLLTPQEQHLTLQLLHLPLCCCQLVLQHLLL